MGTGYTRADTANNIADGNIINASDLDSEYDAIQSAFDASTGHTHDGTAGEGAPIETIGPSQDVVATASVLRPKTDNTVDLGTTSLEYKDLFLDGTAHIDTLDVDENASITGTLGVTGTTTLGTANITTGTITTADINGGNIDATIIGATTAAAITGTTITGTTITGTSFVTSGDMTFGDNDKAIFGAGSDLQIYHSGTQSVIYDAGTGQLNLTTNGSQILLEKEGGDDLARFITDGAVELFYAGAKKLATTSTGIDVTGTVTADGLTSSGNLTFDAVAINTISSNGFLYYNVPTGYTHTFQYNSTNALRINGQDISFYEDTGTTPKFFWDASAENLYLANTNPVLAGVSTGVVSATSFTVGGQTSGADSMYIRRVAAAEYQLQTTNTGSSSGEIHLQPYGGNVGIGTSSPSSKLSMVDASGSCVLGMAGSNGLGSYGSATISTVLNSSGNGYGDLTFGTSSAGTVSEAMRIDSSGNVGIGTSSPASKVTAYQGSAQSPATSGNMNTGFMFGQGLTDPMLNFGTDGDGTWYNSAFANNAGVGRLHRWLTGGTERMRLDASGNVSIGAASANSSRLLLNNGGTSGAPQLMLTATGATTQTELRHDTSNNLIFDNWGGSNRTERMRIKSDGNVQLNGQLHFTDTGSLIARPTTNALSFNTNGSERMRLDASGNLLVGKTATDSTAVGVELNPAGIVFATRDSNVSALFNRKSLDGDIVTFQKDGSPVGSIGNRDADDLYINTAGGTGSLSVGGTEYYAWSSGAIYPWTDNARDLGGASNRWDDVYATNGTIQTSDRNEKQDIAELTDAEQRVAVAAKGLLRKFRWRDAVEAKGDNARTHFGIIAQDLQAAFAAEGLDAGNYAMFISSTWTDEETGEERTRMGVRYSELLAFIIAAI